MALSAEQKILVIGAAAIVGWAWYSNRKDKMAKEAASAIKAPVNPPEDVTKSLSTPRADMVKDYKIVMPSDLVAPNVRQRAAMLTARRYSVDADKLM